EGNHGEDVKECYYYLDSTPTHSYMKALYKYTQARFPYEALTEKNRNRDRNETEFELTDTNAFNDSRYFDVTAEYAKAAPEDLLIRITVTNCAAEAAVLHVLPQLWFRNTWAWECNEDGCEPRPSIVIEDSVAHCRQKSLGRFAFEVGDWSDGTTTSWLMTDNETNPHIHNVPPTTGYYKDAFHRYVVLGETNRVHPRDDSSASGTKVAAYGLLMLPPGQSRTLNMRLHKVAGPDDFAGPDDHAKQGDTIDQQSKTGDSPRASAVGFSSRLNDSFDAIFQQRKSECDEFYDARIQSCLSPEERQISRQALAGLLWTKQFYNYVVKRWLLGDSNQPSPPDSRLSGRNSEWQHVFNRDILSMPDKWEYPWFAAWDSAFHMLPMALVDRHFAKEQLLLFLREWYMHPNGQIPAYEWEFGDVNPPVHAWSVWQVYKKTGPPRHRDKQFLERAFQKLSLNFTWWVNRKDPQGRNIFSGGFLGLDNIGVFDRSKPLPNGYLEQADGTAWMAFFCGAMLRIAIELAEGNPAYGDMASKFFEHYVAIAAAMNSMDGGGLWDEDDGFYYDHLLVDGKSIPIRIRSLVGLMPLLSGVLLEDQITANLPGFTRRTEWFLRYNPKLADKMTCMRCTESRSGMPGTRLLALPSEERFERLLRVMFDESEFL
ncbi:MAG: glucosidase, partial [Planctomycetota bacterium]